jgi:hypothetical protein
MVVCLCVSYTFVQGGHVRVDLVYSAVKHRTKRAIDMFGCLFFMMPDIVITYLYAWFFMWRHLMTPSVTSTSDLDRMLMQARIFRWNVETIGFSPNGFNAYFLFKVLIVLFCAWSSCRRWPSSGGPTSNGSRARKARASTWTATGSATRPRNWNTPFIRDRPDRAGGPGRDRQGRPIAPTRSD